MGKFKFVLGHNQDLGSADLTKKKKETKKHRKYKESKALRQY